MKGGVVGSVWIWTVVYIPENQGTTKQHDGLKLPSKFHRPSIVFLRQ